MDTRCNVGMLTDHIMMIHRAASIENHVVANYAAGVDHDTRTNDTARTNPDIPGNDRVRMASSCKAYSLTLELFVQVAARVVVANADDHGIVVNPVQL